MMTAITLDMTGRVYSIRRTLVAEQLIIELRPGEADQIAAAARAALPDHRSPQPQEAHDAD